MILERNIEEHNNNFYRPSALNNKSLESDTVTDIMKISKITLHQFISYIEFVRETGKAGNLGQWDTPCSNVEMDSELREITEIANWHDLCVNSYIINRHLSVK